MAEQLRFPDGFLWGAATASFQIEGGREDRGDCIWDTFCRWPGKVLGGDTGDVADDHYHRYREDVALMSQLGLKAYRFSVSWPRVLPEGRGAANTRGLDFYSRLVDALLEAGIRPFVTLYHWDLPTALQRLGGWAARDTAYRFRDYAELMGRTLGDRVHDWITHNEPWVVAFLGNLMGVHAPGWEDLGLALQVSHHLLLSHGLAVPVLRATGDARTRVGITLNMSPIHAATDRPEDVAAARRYDGYYNRWFADPLFKGAYPEDTVALYDWRNPRIAPEDMATIQAPIDFLGVNNYTRSVVRAGDSDPLLGIDTVRPEGEYTAMDWEVYPDGLRELLVRLAQDYGPGLDLYVTENGCAYEDVLTPDGAVHDPQRTAYIRRHLAACHAAIQQGAQLRGYFCWSLMDNFEWALGYSKRFGITYVDYETQRRVLKDSALAYREIIAANAVEA